MHSMQTNGGCTRYKTPKNYVKVYFSGSDFDHGYGGGGYHGNGYMWRSPSL